MHRLGLKLWSTNLGHVAPALALHRRGVFDYLELYVVPGSAGECLDDWRRAALPAVLHAPHSLHGFNLSRTDCEEANRRQLAEVESFRAALGVAQVIFHPGVDGVPEETVRQVGVLRGEFPRVFAEALLENKPRVGLQGERCIGSSPDEMAQMLGETGLAFCLDIGHAICYAAWAGADFNSVWADFLKLSPRMFHLGDGDMASHTDAHLSLGAGNFDLVRIIRRIPAGAVVCLETEKHAPSNLDDFERDVVYFRKCAA